jgi:hypothetical protein
MLVGGEQRSSRALPRQSSFDALATQGTHAAAGVRVVEELFDGMREVLGAGRVRGRARIARRDVGLTVRPEATTERDIGEVLGEPTEPRRVAQLGLRSGTEQT